MKQYPSSKIKSAKINESEDEDECDLASSQQSDGEDQDIITDLVSAPAINSKFVPKAASLSSK